MVSMIPSLQDLEKYVIPREGWIPSPMALPSVPFVLTIIPFKSNVNGSARVIDSSLQSKLGETQWNDLLNDAASIGAANESLDCCFSSASGFCLPVSCCCCTYCRYLTAYNRPVTIFDKWKAVMKEKNIPFELCYRPGNFWLALYLKNYEWNQKTYGFMFQASVPDLGAIEKGAGMEVQKAEAEITGYEFSYYLLYSDVLRT